MSNTNMIYRILTVMGTIWITEEVAEAICKKYKIEDIYHLDLELDTVLDIDEQYLMGKEQISDALSIIESNVKKQQDLCEHQDIGKDTVCDRPICHSCGKTFDSWFCPDSPDHNCHYYTDDDGTVELVNGNKVTAKLGQYWDPDYETDDQCIFCGHPEERK